VSSPRLGQEFGRCDKITGANRDCVRLLEGAQSRAVCKVETSEIERSAEIETTFRVELRCMVSECKQVSLKKGFETGPGCLRLRLRVGELSLASHNL
jgi:hypothetical protein